ncbi:hypothetical protein BTJ44_01025 [Bacillus mycoides]|nr:hypothetical protein BTJ44_01025 [Bacillus mycoides]
MTLVISTITDDKKLKSLKHLHIDFRKKETILLIIDVT